MKTSRQVLLSQSWNKAGSYTSARLDFDLRHRRRIKITLEDNSELLLDLPHATRLRDGDGLLCSDGSIVLVIASPEPLLSIKGDMPTLVRIAWHLGNRHLPTQLLPGELRIREDHVLEVMLRGLGGHVHHVSAPFDPEAGAYTEIPHSHGHDDHDHHHH